MDALLNTCGFNAQNRNAIIVTEGINNPNQLSTIDLDDVQHMINALGKLPTNRGGSFIGTVKRKNFEALIWWAHDQEAQGIPVNPDLWTDAELRTTKDLMRSDETEDDITSPLPSTFSADDWTDDQFLFLQHLKQCKSADRKRGLIYVVRKDMPATWVPAVGMPDAMWKLLRMPWLQAQLC